MRETSLPLNLGLVAALIAAPSVMLYLDLHNERWHQHTETNTTLATVTALEPGNHNTVDYRFTVDGRPYSSGATNDGGFHVGDKVVLHYNPLNPLQHTLGNYAPFTVARILFGFVAIDFMTLWIFYLIFIRPLKPRRSAIWSYRNS